MKILIVDDYKEIREIMKKLISKLPYDIKILECEDGDEAIEIFIKEKPDMVLMDLILKKSDGFTAVRKIRSLSDSSLLIVVSQLSEQEYRVESLSAGANDYLNKENLYLLPNMIEKFFSENYKSNK